MMASATRVSLARVSTAAASRRLRRSVRTNETMPATTSPPSHRRMFLTPLQRITAAAGLGERSGTYMSIAAPSWVIRGAATVAAAALHCNQPEMGISALRNAKRVVAPAQRSGRRSTEPESGTLSHFLASDDRVSGVTGCRPPAVVACAHALELEDRDHER